MVAHEQKEVANLYFEKFKTLERNQEKVDHKLDKLIDSKKSDSERYFKKTICYAERKITFQY